MEQSFGFGVRARNVNSVLAIGMGLIEQEGKLTSSRGLEVLRAPGPVTTVYDRPQERVLFNPLRDANPFFHLIDAMWVLSGSNRAALPVRFLGNILRFSDDGEHFHGAYGHRLRHAFGFDQIEVACALLTSKPDSRQVVMSIWHPQLDLAASTMDMPCNDMVMLDIVDGLLNITVCNRSNDMIWGAYGANAVQFSVLQEYMAASIGVGVGRYVQQSNNYHVYTDNPFWLKTKEAVGLGHVDHYETGEVQPFALASSPDEARLLFQDCRWLAKMAEEDAETLTALGFRSPFGQRVLQPAITAYELYKNKDWAGAFHHINLIAASDWRMAMNEWVQRRASKAAA